MPRTGKTNNDYISSGVTISPAIPSAGDKVKITYDGLLSKSGASHIMAHIGFGSSWQDNYDQRMTKTATGYETTVPVSNSDTINIAFKDCANNWDNNSGKNYIFDVTQ